MKKIYINILAIGIILFYAKVNAQTISTFENITLAVDTFKNGSDRLGGFTSGNAFFVNHYDTVYKSWDGFAISDKRDSTTSGYGNQYSALAATGYNNSANYAVGYYSSFLPMRIKLIGAAKGKQLSGFYITNSTYAYLAMKNGGTYNKKFGGSTGKDPDWFKLRIKGYRNGGQLSDSTDFYLADFRFMDSTKNYFIKSWTWLDLTKLGNVDSIDFIMSSTDTAGGFGMNNPAYFCIDNFTTRDAFTGIDDVKIIKNDFIIYPNPAKEYFIIEGIKNQVSLSIFDITGKEIRHKTILNGEKISTENLTKGIYFIRITSDEVVQIKRIIIE